MQVNDIVRHDLTGKFGRVLSMNKFFVKCHVMHQQLIWARNNVTVVERTENVVDMPFVGTVVRSSSPFQPGDAA